MAGDDIDRVVSSFRIGHGDAGRLNKDGRAAVGVPGQPHHHAHWQVLGLLDGVVCKYQIQPKLNEINGNTKENSIIKYHNYRVFFYYDNK